MTDITTYLAHMVDFYCANPEVAQVATENNPVSYVTAFTLHLASSEAVDHIHTLLENDVVEHEYSHSDHTSDPTLAYKCSRVVVALGDEKMEFFGATWAGEQSEQ